MRGFAFPPCPSQALLRRGPSAVLWLVHVASEAQLRGSLALGRLICCCLIVAELYNHLGAFFFFITSTPT